MLLAILQYTGQSLPPKRIIWPQMLGELRLRNSGARLTHILTVENSQCMCALQKIIIKLNFLYTSTSSFFRKDTVYAHPWSLGRKEAPRSR